MLTRITELHEKLLTREWESHKGTFGTVLIVGGSRGMSGSVTLAGRAALRGGAGLVRVAVPECILPTVAVSCAEYTTVPLACENGVMAEAAEEEIFQQAAHASVLAVGPGMGHGAGLTQLVRRMWTELTQPMILDADGLNALAADFPTQPGGMRVITPHPGEFERLSGVSAKNPDAQREAAIAWAAKHACVVVLKGAGTLVTDGMLTWRNTTGNPGMATGGSGDVLTGILAAFMAQLLPRDISLFDIARLAVHLHGRAGDLAAAEIGEVSLIAGDIIRLLPMAMMKI